MHICVYKNHSFSIIYLHLRNHDFYFVAETPKVVYSPRSLTIKEFASSHLSCAFRGHTKARILWQRKGRPLPNNAKTRTVTSYTKGNKVLMVMFRLYLVPFTIRY